ncbi:MAG TPA: hypothetical protein VGO28_07435 [Acidimicrobiia bacterium]|jgi:hypothetical protein
MTDAGYVITGWVLTAVVLVGYWASIARRTRRAQRSVPPGRSTVPQGESPES